MENTLESINNIAPTNYYKNNKDKYKEYYQNNKDKYKEYYQNNKDSLLIKQKEYYENNKDKKGILSK